MGLYDYIYLRRNSKFSITVGFDPTGYLLALTALWVPVVFVPVYSYLFYSIEWKSVEFGLLMLFYVSMFFFGFGYFIFINQSNFIIYEFRFWLPLKKLKSDLNKVSFENVQPQKDSVTILCQHDPWVEMGSSEWVMIKRGGEEFYIGTNNNHLKLYNYLESTIKEYKMTRKE